MNFKEKIVPRSAGEIKVLRISLVTAFVLLIIDQLTKVLVEQNMTFGESIPVIRGLFSLTFVTNKGAAWGMFHGYGMVLFAIGITVTLLAICFLRKLCDGYAERYLAIMVVLSGVIGNSFDRIWRGEVVDFLDFYINKYHWPAFNIADCAICVGIAVYSLSVLLRPVPENDAETAGNNEK